MAIAAPDLRIGIDTGGTFTDVVCVDSASGAMSVTKVASTPLNPALGLVAGVRAALEQAGAGAASVRGLAHGTTVATNALLQGPLDGLGLFVTEGFRNILEIGRQAVPDGYGNSYFWVKPDRAAPVDLVCEIGGRLDVNGHEVRPLDEASVRAAARLMLRRCVRALGVCLLHSYAFDGHERRVRAILHEEAPDLVVSLSCDVLPEYREYERAVTTLVDAFVKPHMDRYLARVREALGPDLRQPPFLVMQSNGGVVSAEQVLRKPISTALSGPAAGVLGAAVIAKLAGFADVVTLDAGGTSTDLSLIIGGEATITNGGSVGPFPVRIPMIAIETIGTGGGSIAWISREGHLRVGPKSAGAEPGPLCYPNGGDQPTITDANLVLGRLPSALIGGGVALDVGRARAGFERLAADLRSDLSPEALAAGVVDIANWGQANRIRQMTVQKGIDPRGFALLSFGGAGPAQSAAVMDLVGMGACLIPPNPGNLAAFGLLAVDWRTDHVATKVMTLDGADGAMLEALFAQLEAQAGGALARDGVPRQRTRLVREAELRYVGQSMEMRVAAPAGPVDASFLGELAQAFHRAHKRQFGYDYAGVQPIELVNVCVSGFGAIERPVLPKIASGDPSARLTPRATRPVWFEGAFRETPVFDRVALWAGARILGPAVVEEFGSTTIVPPHQEMRVDPHGIMILTASSGERS